MKLTAVLLLPLLATLAPPPAAPPARAQAHLSAATARQTAADSAALLRDARREQSRFEVVRRNHMEQTWERFGGDCDERVGRFCLTYGRTGDRDDWETPAEAERVTVARARLVAVLDEAADALPGDAWVAGQRVRYLLEAGETARAAAAARDCRAERWWCSALLGFALHRADDFGAAAAAFDSALAVMPDPERREWTDLSMLLPHGELRGYRRAEGPEREAMERRFWWLSDPLWLRPGNDRLTEHRARLVMARLQDRARSTEGISWGDDLHQLLVRYGWPVGWKRQREQSFSLQSGTSVISYYAPRSRQFSPPLRSVDAPASLAADDWAFEDRAARSVYAPAYVHRFHSEPLAHQLAIFQRGDSLLVLADAALSRDSLPEDGVVLAGLVIVPDADAAPAVDSLRTRDAHARLRLTVPARPAVLSLEAIAGERWAARARVGLAPPPRVVGIPALSDLLLVEPADDGTLPATLDEAFARMRPATRVTAGETLVLFWEVYGMDAAELESARLSLSVRRTDGSWLRRAAERVGLVGAETPIRLRWEEVVEPVDGVYARALTLGIPADVPAGAYAIEASLLLPGREPITTVRAVRVER